MKSKTSFILVILLILSGCVPLAGTIPESDSGVSFETGSRIPVDSKVYTLKVEVLDSENHTEIRGEGHSYSYNGYGGSNFYLTQSGKGIFKVKLLNVYPDPLYISVNSGQEIILKTTDLKMIVLDPGDIVEIKCKEQYEVIAASVTGETLDEDSHGTWEFDYCRMISPAVE